MSTVTSAISPPDAAPVVPVPAASVPRLHRLAEVRRQEGVTRRAIARRLGVSPEEVLQQEENRDLPLSTLYAWQEALHIPATEFLVEDDAPLSTPVLKRAQLLRMMKTIMSIVERSKQSSVRRLARFLAGQVMEVMPELKEVEPWPTVGRRRTTRELGQAALRRFDSALGIELDRHSA